MILRTSNLLFSERLDDFHSCVQVIREQRFVLPWLSISAVPERLSQVLTGRIS